MQIYSQHFSEESRHGIKQEHFLKDTCMNIYAEPYYLSIAFKSGELIGKLLVLIMPDLKNPGSRQQEGISMQAV